MRVKAWTAGVGIAFLLATVGRAEELVDYGQIDASAEAHAIGEAARQAAVRRQVELNDVLRWRSGFPPANGAYYYPTIPLLSEPLPKGWLWLRPWRNDFAARQPVGRMQVQTGPDRWESHPVYAAPPLPPVAPPETAPMPTPEEVEVVPPPTGPQEF